MAETLAERIMAAADAYAGEWWAAAHEMQYAQERAEDNRATLAALVAEACAPVFSGTLESTVCRWTVNADGASGACGEDGWAASYLECFRCCPGCGGLIEEADGQEATDE